MNIERLIEMVNDYFSAEEDFRIFLKDWVPGWFPSKTPEEQVGYTKHSERSNERWNAIMAVCKIIDIDIDALIAMVKAMRRWEKRNQYQYCLHVTYRTERNVQRFLEGPVDDWSGHYHSTGRKNQTVAA